MSWFRNSRVGGRSSDKWTRLPGRVDEILAAAHDVGTAFSDFTRLLEDEFDIHKGFLALREENQTRFLAVASWKKGSERRNLSLRLPDVGSLFEKVAESGQIYSETFTEFFDGNRIERSLLFDKDTVSFMLRPLKHDARLVGIIGYSSDESEAFVTIEEGLLDPAFDRLAAFLGRLQPELAHADLP